MNYLSAPDGAKIAFEDEGGGRPLVLLHGLMAHSGFFRLQRPLASDFRLISVDLRGHGQSLRRGEAPRVEQLAGDVAHLADSLELEGAVGVGWSLGASVLWRVLTGPAAPRFAGSVIVDMTPKVQNATDWELGLSPELCEARRAGIANEFDTFAVNAAQAMFAQPMDAASTHMAQWAAREFAANDPASIAALWDSLAEEDLRPLLGRIEHRTLIVHGAHSQLYGSDTAEFLADALPNASCIRFERSGHAPHIQQPDLFNDTIRKFAAALPRTREIQESHSTH